MSRKKATIVGAGNVGATTAHLLFNRGNCDIVLVDVVEGLPQGKALDLLESGPLVGSDAQVTGVNTYEETAGSDVVVITAGTPRRPGMSRDELLFTNMGILKEVTREVIKHSPESVLIVVTNPLDAMTQHALEVSNFPRERVIGMGGVLDTARFQTFLARELQASVQDIHAYVLGEHGDSMVPLVNTATVAGIPITRLLPRENIEAIVQRTRRGGTEIVNFLKNGSAFYSPAAAVVRMVEAILLDRHQILPCAVLLKGEYGISDVVVGVPVNLGIRGVEEIVEVELSKEEFQALRRSAEEVRLLIQKMHAQT